MPSSTFHRRITIGFMVVILCTALIAGAAILSIRSIRAGSEQIANNYAHQLILVERLDTVIERNVASARGLLMTNDEIYAQRVTQARGETRELIAELRKEIQSSEGQQALDQIERAEQVHQDDLDAAIALRRSGASMDAVTQHWRLNTSVHRDELTAAVQMLRARKEALLEQARQEQRNAAARLTKLIFGMTAASLLLAVMLAFVITRTLVRMYDAETLARQAADEARQWFATTLSSIGDAVIATDTQGNVTFMNAAAEILTAWDRADALGKSLDDVFPIFNEKTGEALENPVKKVLQTGVAVQLANSTLLAMRDGKRRPIDDSAAPIRDAKRGITGVVLVFRDISERRRAEAAIRESREWLSTTVRSIGDAVIATDRDGRVTLMNPVAEHLTGWAQAQAVGAPLEAVFNIVNEHTRKRLQNPVEKVLATGQIVGLANHTILIAKDGTEWPLDDSGAPIRDERGNIIGVVLVFREVTERRKAEDTLRRLSAIVESSDDAIIGKTLDGVITSWNAGAEQLYGYSREEVLGRPVSLLVPENQVDEMPQILARLARGEHIDHFETVRRCKDGRLVNVFLNVSPIRDDSAHVIGASTIARDVSGKKKIEEALNRAYQQQRLALEAAGLGAWDYHFETGDVSWDERCHAQFGFSAGERVTDESAIARIYPDDQAGVRDALDRALAGVDGGGYHCEFRVRWTDGSLHWIASHGRVYFAEEAGQRRPVRFIGVNSDFTARKRAEEALIQSEKLASVGRMAATIAHEINNPLEAIVNSIYLAIRAPGLPPEARIHLQTAEEQLERVTHLTRQTLGFYRESRTRSVVKLPELVDDVLAFYSRKLQDRKIEVCTRYDLENRLVAGTAGELRQVLSNLLTNSLDALPSSGGRLHVRVKGCSAVNGSPSVRLTVADTGAGIARDHVRRIFEPFFTTKQSVGTGLGLWITQEIVVRHGGRVVVRSRPGKGTVFWIYLPATTEKAAAATA